jgi:predicted transcriptional regulator
MKYRSRNDIVAKILESASSMPISKTHLMHMACMPHEQITSYAAMLIEKELLSLDKRTHLYYTSAKGRKLLELYNEMQQLYQKRTYWQNQLKSLGIEPKIGKKNNDDIDNELNDYEELQNLADALKLSMYQDYKITYNKQAKKNMEEESESTIINV